MYTYICEKNFTPFIFYVWIKTKTVLVSLKDSLQIQAEFFPIFFFVFYWDEIVYEWLKYFSHPFYIGKLTEIFQSLLYNLT